MPIYEFYSPDSNKIYSFLAKSLAYGERVPACPDNPSFKMEKRVSDFAFIGKAKDPADADGLDDIDDGQMEKIMAELERDMAGMDEENPDPKQMAHLMRKMSGMTGEKLPEEMEEMVSRMESGEDPEALEAEFGDALDSDDFGGEGSAATKLNRIRNRMRGPVRDANLYDMSEYCS